MKAVRIIHEEILQTLDCQERRIIAYVASKKNQTGHFPVFHKHSSKRLRAFHTLIAKGIISVVGSDSKSIRFRLNPKYNEQKFHRFYTSIGTYMKEKQKLRTKQLYWFENFIKNGVGIPFMKNKAIQPVKA